MFYGIYSISTELRKTIFFVLVTEIKAVIQKVTLNTYFCLVDSESTMVYGYSERRYSRYLALQTVRGAADSANKHDYDVSSLMVACYDTTALYQLFFSR